MCSVTRPTRLHRTHCTALTVALTQPRCVVRSLLQLCSSFKNALTILSPLHVHINFRTGWSICKRNKERACWDVDWTDMESGHQSGEQWIFTMPRAGERAAQRPLTRGKGRVERHRHWNTRPYPGTCRLLPGHLLVPNTHTHTHTASRTRMVRLTVALFVGTTWKPARVDHY